MYAGQKVNVKRNVKLVVVCCPLISAVNGIKNKSSSTDNNADEALIGHGHGIKHFCVTEKKSGTK